jgi:hypothetical protein
VPALTSDAGLEREQAWRFARAAADRCTTAFGA